MKTQHATVAPDNSKPPARTLADLDLATQAAVRVFLSFIAQSDLPPVARVLLYGSHARGDHRADSDIDIAVVLRGDAPPRSERGVFRRKLSFLLDDAILESLQPLSAVLLWESMLDEPDNAISSGFYHNVLTDGVEVRLRDDSLKIDPKPAKAYIPPTGWSGPQPARCPQSGAAHQNCLEDQPGPVPAGQGPGEPGELAHPVRTRPDASGH